MGIGSENVCKKSVLIRIDKPSISPILSSFFPPKTSTRPCFGAISVTRAGSLLFYLIHFHLEIFTANGGEIVVSAGLVPFQRAAQTLFGIVNAVRQAADDRSVTVSGLIVDRAYRQIAGTGAVSEEHTARGRYDTAVVLGNDVIDHGDVRAVVQNNTLLAVVDVDIIRNDVFTDYKTVFKALNGYAANHVVVVLVTRHHETDRMTGIFLQFNAEHCVADGLEKTELTVHDVNAAGILQIDGGLRGIHFIAAHGYRKFQIGQRDQRRAEFTSARRALRGGQNGIRTGVGIVLLGRFPVGEDRRAGKNTGILDVTRQRMETRRAVGAVNRTYLIAVQEAAGHFSLQLDVCRACGDHELGTRGHSVHLFDRGRSNAVASRRKGEKDLSSAALENEIDRRLNRRGIVGHAVALGTKIKNIKTVHTDHLSFT